MPTFAAAEGLRLHYAERGAAAGRPVVLLHGLLFSHRLMERLAGLLPGYRVLLLDLRGHGLSSTPQDAASYTWRNLSADVVSALDHAGAERAVVGGLSLGANVALACGVHHPDRLAGMILEMPVLSRGIPVGRNMFGPMAAMFERSARLLAPVTAAVRRLPVPSGIPELGAARDVLGAHPSVAAAVLRGLLAEEPLPDDEEHLRAIDIPALVVGHRGDPLHALDDARDLAAHLPRAELMEASSILEHRLRPAPLAAAILRFLDHADWDGRP